MEVDVAVATAVQADLPRGDDDDTVAEVGEVCGAVDVAAEEEGVGDVF